MTILTAEEAAAVLRVEATDPDMLNLLPLVDRYIAQATGHDWAADDTVREEAKAAARMLLVLWHENPGMVGQENALKHGLTHALTILGAIGLRYRQYRVRGRDTAGGIALDGALRGDQVVRVVGLYPDTSDLSARFESALSVDGQIQQTSGGLGAYTLMIETYREGVV